MLSLSKGLLFVWEPTDLVMSWHVPDLPKWFGLEARKILVKNLMVGQTILILKWGSVMERVNFLKRLQGVFRKNRKLHYNKPKHASKDSICTKVH